jgi:diguanylate cyclase
MTRVPTAVEIARQALRRLARLGLPPTPENYETHYREIAGMPPREAGASGTRAEQAQMLEMLRALLQLVTQANDGLHSDLGRFGNESRNLVTQLEANSDAKAAGELVQGLTASATWLLTQVEATRQELDVARQQINRVHEDLERAEAMAVTDPLTELPNRRGLDAAISREMSRARRHKSELCFAIIDIDHFKRINDQHGHAVGDQALVHLADVIRPGIRDTDVVGRFGGEEFLLLLPDTPLASAEFTVSRLLRTLERSPLHTRNGEVTMTFSAGLAQWQPGESAEQVIERADQAMYAAKRAGRARVHVAENALPEPAPGAAPG